MEESITISRESYDRMVGEIKTLEKYNSRITA